MRSYGKVRITSWSSNNFCKSRWRLDYVVGQTEGWRTCWPIHSGFSIPSPPWSWNHLTGESLSSKAGRLWRAFMLQMELRAKILLRSRIGRCNSKGEEVGRRVHQLPWLLALLCDSDRWQWDQKERTKKLPEYIPGPFDSSRIFSNSIPFLAAVISMCIGTWSQMKN